MNTSSQNNVGEKEKQVYLRNMRIRIAEKQTRLSFIKRKVKDATESHRITVSEQLLKAEVQADSSIATLRAQVELLEKADNESWETRRFEVEAAWDELSQAFKKVIARFP